MRQEESKLQIACVRWFRYEYPRYGGLLFAVPNGGKRHMSTAKKLKAEGVVAGVSDLILMVPRHGVHGLCIEMKTPKGKQSPNQKAWQKLVEDEGYMYMVVRSFDRFEQLMNDYLNG